MIERVFPDRGRLANGTARRANADRPLTNPAIQWSGGSRVAETERTTLTGEGVAEASHRIIAARNQLRRLPGESPDYDAAVVAGAVSLLDSALTWLESA